MNSIFNFFSSFSSYNDYVTLVVKIPKLQLSAMETLLYMERKRELSKDLIVGEALDHYLKQRVWATTEKTDNHVEINRVETFGFRQAKNNPSN